MDSAHTRRWEIAEVVFGIPFLAAIFTQWAAPRSIFLGNLRIALIPAGVAITLLGISIIVMARRELAKYAQPTDPGQPTRMVVTTGMYALSRNPLYLGGALVLLGIALALNHLWMIAALLLSLVLCHYLLIAPEEKYLTAKFREDYQAYMAEVHRWIGRK